MIEGVTINEAQSLLAICVWSGTFRGLPSEASRAIGSPDDSQGTDSRRGV